jgi:hypothetical protein
MLTMSSTSRCCPARAGHERSEAPAGVIAVAGAMPFDPLVYLEGAGERPEGQVGVLSVWDAPPDGMVRFK